MGANSCVNLGKRDIVVGEVEKSLIVLGVVTRLRRGIRRIAVLSACIRSILVFVTMVEFMATIGTFLYPGIDVLELSRCSLTAECGLVNGSFEA